MTRLTVTGMTIVALGTRRSRFTCWLLGGAIPRFADGRKSVSVQRWRGRLEMLGRS